MTKQDFIEYVKFFDSMTFEEELDLIFNSHSSINDVSGISHSTEELNDYAKTTRGLFQCDDKTILSTSPMPDVEFFVFAVIGCISDGFVGTCYCMTKSILQEIANKNKCVVRETANLCVSKEQLDRMKALD